MRADQVTVPANRLGSLDRNFLFGERNRGLVVRALGALVVAGHFVIEEMEKVSGLELQIRKV